jgi:hypothetical protein
MTKEQMLAVVHETLRSMPPPDDFQEQKPDAHEWLGRAAALVNKWNSTPLDVADIPRQMGTSKTRDDLAHVGG